QILARNRQKKVYGKNSVSASTTPEGFRFCYDRWERRCGDEYVLYRAPTRSNPYLPDGYIESLQEDYPKHLLDAYLEGYFVNLTVGTVYLSFSRDKCSTSATVQPSEPIFVGMDFNVGRMSSVIHVKRDGNPHAVDEITNGLDTPHMCRMLKEKYPGRMIYVYPDASGGSRKSVNASTTDIKILTDAGFKVRAKKKNPPIRDRINSMNAGFEKSYKVSIEGCPEYVRCLEQQAYDKRGEPDKTQDLDHLPDAGGYFMHYEYPLIKPVMDINIGMAH
ncbi:MAG: terminase, partial [Cyanobacteria bacterium P01_A01_bin.17]